jgi:N-acetylmuramate 1-kinase
MSDREARIAAFLSAAGWGGSERRLLAADASFRRYDRLHAGDRRAVLMDAPPPQEDVRPFLRIARVLQSLGLSAPEILAEDIEAGLLLLEDFGDRTYTRLLAAGHDETVLYALATDTLIALHRGFTPPLGTGVPPYDETRLLNEVALLTDWYLPAMTGSPVSTALRDDYLMLWRDILAPLHDIPATLVLRDFHVDNLMLLDRRGVAACGLLDFQDAAIGPQLYDVMSLLMDERRDVPPALAAAMRARYLAAFPALDAAQASAALAVLGAQRHCKNIGIFTRLCRRDHKPGYLVHIPRVWRLVGEDVRHPTLRRLAEWLDTHIPPPLRGIPPSKPAAA